MAKNLRKYHVSICAKKKLLSLFNTKKVTAEKQKLPPFLVNFSKFYLLRVIVEEAQSYNFDQGN